MKARLTRRGRVVLGIAVVAALLGWGFGGRALNAVVMPALALLVAGGVSAWRLDRPTVTRTVQKYGFVGDSRTVELVVDTDQSFTASVVDELSSGLDGGGEFETVVDGSTITYDVDLPNRGAHTIGPLRVVARDLFGFWERSFYYGFTTEVVAYPPIRSLGDDLAGGFTGATDDREHFDSLREYQRGDALRDVNWKASAKRASGDMVVTRYAGRGSSEQVVVAAEAAPSHPDEVAEAAASVAAHLLDAGLAVGVVTHQGSVAPSTGAEHRRHLLDLLARMGRGSLPPSLRDEADVLVTADRSGAHVELAGGRRPYRSLLRNRSPGVTA